MPLHKLQPCAISTWRMLRYLENNSTHHRAAVHERIAAVENAKRHTIHPNGVNVRVLCVRPRPDMADIGRRIFCAVNLRSLE